MFQESMLFLPTTLPQDHTYSFKHNFEELFLTADDGAVLNGIHFKLEEPKGVILYFHGNAGDLQRWGTITSYFVEKNYDVVVMDYRTYGKSTGDRSEEAFYSDGQLFYNYTTQYYKEHDITVYGRSLGSGVASKITKENNPKQLILETPYYSIADVAKHRFPILPVTKMLKYKFPNNEHLKQVQCPIYIIHGTDDRVVPYKSGKKLADELIGETKLFTIQGGHHNDLINYDDYHKAIQSILE